MASSLTLSCLFLSLLSLSTALSSQYLHRPSLSAGDVHDLLKQYGFPKGLFPDNVKSYTLSDNGDFTVELMTTCYVDFVGQTVFYDNKITGKLSYGSFEDVEGISVRETLFFLQVTAIKSYPSSGRIEFIIGFLSKSLSTFLFENVPSCSRKLSLDQTH